MNHNLTVERLSVQPEVSEVNDIAIEREPDRGVEPQETAVKERSSRTLNIGFIGDIVGASGVKLTTRAVPFLRQEYQLDLCFANGENAAGGLGINKAVAEKLYNSGVDGISLGNHAWGKWELLETIQEDLRMVRPANGHKTWPGRGFAIFETAVGLVALVNLLGGTFMSPSTSPFDEADVLIPYLKDELNIKYIVVDFHGEATAEKIAFGLAWDGRVTAVLGTHTHVPTMDARVLPDGTGFMTDVGMAGPEFGVIGMDAESALRRFTRRLPSRYQLAKGPAILNAVILRCDVDTGKTLALKPLTLRDQDIPPRVDVNQLKNESE